VLIFFNRQFLTQASNHQTSAIWSKYNFNLRIPINTSQPSINKVYSEMSLCCQILRNYLHLARLLAFSPYHWLFSGKLQPLQQCILILTYLKGHPQNSDTQLLRYIISEVFEIFIKQGDTNSEEPSLYQTIPTYEAPWQMLH
jgi:hypothetical protein